MRRSVFVFAKTLSIRRLAGDCLTPTRASDEKKNAHVFFANTET